MARSFNRQKNRWTNVALVSLAGFLASWFIVFSALGLGASSHPPIPTGPDDKSVTVLGSNIRYRDIGGTEPPVIFVHGHGPTLDDWEPVLSALRSRRLIALDLIGYGGSDRPDLPYDLQTHQRYLVAFMDAVGVDQAFLVGHSIGGAIVAWTAAHASERVLGSVLIAPTGVPGSLIHSWPSRLLDHPGVLNRLAFEITRDALFKAVFPSHITAQRLGMWGSNSQEYVEALSDISRPTMLIWSTGDTTTPIAFSNTYEERIKELRFERVPVFVGHMVPRAYPEGTASLVEDFLDGLDGEPGQRPKRHQETRRERQTIAALERN